MIPYVASVFIATIVGAYLQRYSLEKAARKRAKGTT